MEKSHPSTHLKFSVKVGTETVCTILTRNESVDIVTHAGATVTCQAVSKECHDQATLISERENVCDEKNSEITERTQEDEEPTESNVDNVELLLQLTAYINENKQNGLTQRSTSICNTGHQDEEIDESDGGDTPSGVVEHDMALHSPWLLARVITALQLLRGAWSSLWVPKRCDRMLRGDLIDHHASVPPEPLPATRDVVIRQTMGGKLLGRERQITNVRMMLVLPCDVNWVHLLPADPHNEDRMAILNMPRKMDLHLVFVATCFVQPATADVLDMLTVSEVTGTTQAVSGQYCVKVCVIITLLGDHTDCVSWAMEDKASLVPWAADTQSYSVWRLMENQAFLVQGHVDSKPATEIRAMVNQVFLLQMPVDSKAATDSKAMDNQASLEQGPVDSKASTDSKAMVNQASLAQGPVASKAATDSKAMVNQASLAQGPVDSKASTDAKAMVNQASLAQGPADSQADAGTKAMVNQAPLVQGSLDCLTGTESRAVENQGQADTVSLAVQIQPTLAIGSADSQTDTISKVAEHQTSPVSHCVDSRSDTVWRACEKQTSPVPRLINSQTSTEILILKPAVVPGALHIQAVTCPRLSATQAHVVPTADTPKDHVDMVVQETKKPINDMSNETKPPHDHIHTASFNETTANEDTGDLVIPGARMSTDQKTSSHKHDTTVIHHPDSRTRRRRRKAPSTQRRDRARTQRWIHKKINIHGQTKGAEKPITHTSSCQLPKQEERTARSCTECVGMLLEHAGTTTEINMMKENIVLELEPDRFPDRMRSLYGAMVALLPNRKQWQLTKLMCSTVKGAHETCVHNMIRDLRAEGKKLGHLLQYFSQENTKRDDIIKLITQIHQCDFCNQTAKDVIGGQCQV